MTPQLMHEALYILPREHKYAFQLLMQREADFERTLQGIASCGTDCKCCKMHSGHARAVLDKHGIAHGFARLGERFPELLQERT